MPDWKVLSNNFSLYVHSIRMKSRSHYYFHFYFFFQFNKWILAKKDWFNFFIFLFHFNDTGIFLFDLTNFLLFSLNNIGARYEYNSGRTQDHRNVLLWWAGKGTATNGCNSYGTSYQLPQGKKVSASRKAFALTFVFIIFNRIDIPIKMNDILNIINSCLLIHIYVYKFINK